MKKKKIKRKKKVKVRKKISKRFKIALLAIVIVAVVVIFLVGDWDRDGLATVTEFRRGTSIFNPDTDGDGLKDGLEVNTHRTNPSVSDSDGDSLDDGLEVNTYGTNPLSADTDGDGLDDGTEVKIYRSNPLVVDTDGDGLSDEAEINYGTNPTSRDTDGDGLDDKAELDGWPVVLSNLTYHVTSNPTEADADEDGASDLKEYEARTDPNKSDTDGDGLSDGAELGYGEVMEVFVNGERRFVYSNPLMADTDNDGLDDYTEYIDMHTDPGRADIDNDGIIDSEELSYGTDATLSDTDADEISDGDEVKVYLTDPLNKDTDGDGLNDGHELDLQGFGANPRRRDIFVEIDRMAGSRSLTTDEQNMLVSTFRNAPIRNPDGSWGVELHLYFDDVDLPYLENFGEESIHQYSKYSRSSPFVKGFYWALLISSEEYPYRGQSYGFGFYTVAKSSDYEHRVGSVFMHELGHCIGLYSSVFDGIDSQKYSFSEYMSVMNYNQPWDYYGYSSGGVFNDWGYLEGEGFERWW